MNLANKTIALEYAKTKMPNEACGLVIVEHGLEVFVPCRNISEHKDMFEIHPDDFAKAEDRGEILEVFHSHCFSPPFPSMVDKVVCGEASVKWSIVSVPNGVWHEHLPDGFKAPLIGRQWAHGHLDCYSLIIDYFEEKLGLDICDFDRKFEWWLHGEDLYMKNYEAAGFRKVDQKEIKEHDIILMQVRSPVVNHGGIYLGNGQMLHHLHRRLSGRDVWDGYYAKHTVQVVRHNSL